MTTSPLPRHSSEGEIDAMEDFFSAFVFKIQANMNKAHRDRIAFLRVCSGRFDAEKEVYHCLLYTSAFLRFPVSNKKLTSFLLTFPLPCYNMKLTS